MADVKQTVEHALNEGRILILGAEVLLGFQYRSVFETGFDKLPPPVQYLKVGGLGLLLVALARRAEQSRKETLRLVSGQSFRKPEIPCRDAA